MFHIHGRVPDGIQLRGCTHKPTRQRFAVLEDSANVETIHGTMVGRAGDVLMEGEDGTLYVLTARAFAKAYDVDERNG